MVKQLKTLNVAQGGYEAPRCRVYSITVESVIAQSRGSNPNNHTEYLDTEDDGGDLT